MNWGWKITWVYIGFAAMILTLVYKSTQENYELVTTDYYKKEQLHQNKIDAAKNVRNENQFVICNNTSKGVQIIFPSNANKVEKDVEIYCASDENKDKIFKTQENSIAVALQPARYKLKISWKVADRNFYQEKEVWVK